MAWVERLKLKGGEARFRVAERAADGRVVKGPLMRSERDAQRLAGRTGIEKQREELGLVKKDYPIRDLLRELPERLRGSVSPAYIVLYGAFARVFERFLDERAPAVRNLSDLSKPVLLEYRTFRLEDTSQRSGRPSAPKSASADELTVAEVALMIGYRHAAVSKLIWKGHLEARKVEGNRFDYYLVRRASVEAFMASERYARGKQRAMRGNAAAKAAERPKPERKLRHRTINRELTMIRTLLNKAVEWGLIDENPITSSKSFTLPEFDSVPFRALSDEEFDLFRRLCAEWLLPPLLTAALVGLREEEVRQLEWPDVDLPRRILRLRQKANLRLKSQGFTGVHEFVFTIPDVLLPYLSALHLKRQAHEDSFVFHNSEGRPFPKGALRKRFMHVMRKCGIVDVTQVHALRKTFITHLARREKNIFLVQELARHKDLRTTRRYVNVFDEDKARVMSGFDLGTKRVAAPPPADPSPRVAESA
ncbi:MAG TPA: tyrosine-type recombinase/integrase [Planctomycetota bacterium]|nr:tyrosine-type recombinase/integrase [Planctomycetota bacterium]